MKRISVACMTLLAMTAGTQLWIGASRAQAQQPPDEQAVPAAAARGRGAAGGSGRGGRGGGGGGDPFAGADLSPNKPPFKAASVAEEQKSFLLQPGYHMTPVLTEPDIKEPMEIAFDGNGRMFVLEMRSYMQDADATGELAPTSLISLHEDTKGTGVYDKHTVFIDHLVVPRFVMPFGPNAVLVMESNTDDVYKYTDTNGDGVADKKELFTSNFGRSANIEHQQSTLFWGMDNWLYSTVNAFRVRWTPRGVIREATTGNGAEWGVTQDNYGKIYFMGGASGLPAYFQYPIHYGNFSMRDEHQPGLGEPWGVAGVGDYQGGTGMIRKDTLQLGSTTAGSGNNIYRGDRLPKELIGDYFYGEVTARILRRLKQVNTEGMNQLQNVYQPEKSEFLRSTDNLFRPVYTTNAPDGTMYIDDAYRGIIQEGNWTQPGSYLRAKVDQYQIAKVTNHGRIWRLTYDGMEPDRTMPRMNNESAAQLVTHLTHPNGWWRDTAQHLLVLKQDKSVVPALLAMVKTSPNELGRIHALWTLEGLDSLDATLVRQLMKDADKQIRIQAIRASETLYKGGDKTLITDYRNLTKDPDTDVDIQALLTLNLFKAEGMPDIVKEAEAASKARGVQVVGEMIVNPPVAGGRGGGRGPQFTAAQQETLAKGKAVFEEICFTCHGDDGRGAPVPGRPGATKAAPLAGSPRVNGHRDYVIKAVMYGLKGAIDGKTYSEEMVPNGGNKDEWIASVVSYVRNSFGNSAGFATLADVARIRAANPNRDVRQSKDGVSKTRFSIPELQASLPRPLLPQLTWKATASVNPETADSGFNFLSWTGGTNQQAGTWYQVELPQVYTINEIQFESPGGRAESATGAIAQANGGGRGARGGSGGRGGFAGVAGASGGFGGGGRGGLAQQAPPNPGYPRGYKAQVSVDGKTWSDPIAEGVGDSTTTYINFKPVKAKFVRLTLTETSETAPGWAIQKLRLYEPPLVTVASAKPATPRPPALVPAPGK
jgi:mono/diheme cytochrome c family protein